MAKSATKIIVRRQNEQKIPNFTDSQIFDRIHQQYGTGIEEYDKIEYGIISLLRI